MKRDSSLGRLRANVLLIVSITLLLVPNVRAQNKFKTLHKFNGVKDGSRPSAALVFDRAGNLYGTTYTGGTRGFGTVFELKPNSHGSWTLIVLHSFRGKDGGGPFAPLIFDQTGSLYGTTLGGGASNSGTVFKLTPKPDGRWVETVLYSFTGLADGLNPLAGLIFDPGGNLYGTTELGGDGIGTVFKLTPNTNGSWTESVLYSFCSLKNCADGDEPFAGLTFDKAGNLYGTTWLGGGVNQAGTVFKLTPNTNGSWTESVLYDFSDGNDGGRPISDLIFDQAGNLYGATDEGGDLDCRPSSGCGVVFQLTPNSDGSWTESVLHSFRGGRDDGAVPSDLAFDQAGNVYGTTGSGGDINACNGAGCGVVFKLVPNSNGRWKEILLHKFVDRPGASPHAGLITDGAGNLYGTTAGDIRSTFGSVFEVTP